jgi:feruloyl esterase
MATMGALSACGDGGGDDLPPPITSLSTGCPGYASSHLPHGARIVTTEIRPAQGELSSVCIVRGTIVSSPASTINWAVEVPEPSQWNGKTLTVGGGGFDGFIPTDAPYYQAMYRGTANQYVKIGSDSGHQSTGFEWANDDVALRNHAYEANHLVLEVGTRIALEMFGRTPAKRYMFGQSNGGRSGLAAIQHYPDDYDGVIALQPAISQQAHEANVGPTMERHLYSDPANWMSPAKVQLYAAAEMAACDGLDGAADGIISNVSACHYVPTNLLCAGSDNDACLTAGQIETMRLIYTDKATPVTFTRGQTGYPRFSRGGAATSDFAFFVFGSSFAARDAFNYMVADETARLLEQNPEASGMTHDPAQWQAGYTRLANQIDTNEPDLSAFAARGGKLIIWYGTADTCVSLYRTADYFDSVKEALGTDKVNGFARMITTPGVGHVMDGPGPQTMDLIDAMDQWVEAGQAPDNLVASKLAADGAVLYQRPMCQYPAFPRYKGTGDMTKATSFTCSSS